MMNTTLDFLETPRELAKKLARNWRADKAPGSLTTTLAKFAKRAPLTPEEEKAARAEVEYHAKITAHVMNIVEIFNLTKSQGVGVTDWQSRQWEVPLMQDRSSMSEWYRLSVKMVKFWLIWPDKTWCGKYRVGRYHKYIADCIRLTAARSHNPEKAGNELVAAIAEYNEKVENLEGEFNNVD